MHSGAQNSIEKSKYLGKTFVISNIHHGYPRGTAYWNNEFPCNAVWYADELELATDTYDSKEIIKRTLDGEQWTLPEWNNVYLAFDNGELRYSNGIPMIWNRWEHRKDWVKYQAPPKFAVNSLVYNTDGTIGKIVEDKGVYKGARRYSVRFNAIRDAVKGCDESELTAYESR